MSQSTVEIESLSNFRQYLLVSIFYAGDSEENTTTTNAGSCKILPSFCEIPEI